MAKSADEAGISPPARRVRPSTSSVGISWEYADSLKDSDDFLSTGTSSPDTTINFSCKFTVFGGTPSRHSSNCSLPTYGTKCVLEPVEEDYYQETESESVSESISILTVLKEHPESFASIYIPCTVSDSVRRTYPCCLSHDGPTHAIQIFRLPPPPPYPSRTPSFIIERF